METKTVDVIIPVYKPGDELKELLSRLMKQSVLPAHIFILQTIEEGEPLIKPLEEPIQVFPVKKAEFDHGATRAYGAELSEADYILFMTQDAVPANREVIEELVKAMGKENIGVAYGRQMAKKDADIAEQLTRLYNYPEQEQLKTRADLETLGVKTYFCSDVCAMYDRVLYMELGGFSYPAIFNEDMVMASKVIQAGYRVFYAAKAKVFHSHSYTCKQQFKRNFDLGVSQSQYSEIFETVSSEKEGAGFAKKTILELCKKGHPGKAVYFAWQCAFRLAGYKLGRNYERLPRKVVLKCTMSPGYWKE